MGDLSLKGIVRKYLGGIPAIGSFSVQSLFFASPRNRSLRSQLEMIATENYSFDCKEKCGPKQPGYGWKAAFLQIWTHVIVGINLNFDPAISKEARDVLVTTWGNAIENAWSNKWGCVSTGESTCRLTFEVQWTTISPHHNVTVSVCNPVAGCRENAGRWFDTTQGTTAAHEFGHLLGLKDEYSSPAECSTRSPINTNTVMDQNNVTCFPSRLFKGFADNIDSNITNIAEYSHDATVCN